jgi:GAF domain-containing protein/CheY-like chemotaxis protein
MWTERSDQDARRETSAEERVRRLDVLARFGQTACSSLDIGQVLPVIARTAVDLMGVPFVSLWIVDESTGRLDRRAASDGRVEVTQPVIQVAPGEGIVGWVAKHRCAAEVSELGSDERAVPREWDHELGWTSALALPIVHGGTVLGVLVLFDRRPVRVDVDDRTLLDRFVAQAAVALRNARLYAQLLEETERRRVNDKTLADLGRFVSRSLDPTEVARRVVEGLLALFHAVATGFYRLDGATGDLVSVAVAGDHGQELDRPVIYPAGTGTIGLAVRTRQVVVTPDVLEDPRLELTPEIRARVLGSGYRSVLAVPLVADGTVIGALAIGVGAGRRFTDEEVRLADVFTGQAALALENARLYEQARRRGHEAEELARVARTVTESLDLRAVADGIVEGVLPLFRARSSGLLVMRPDGSLEAIAWAGTAREGLCVGQVLGSGVGAAGRAVETATPTWTRDVLAEPGLSVPEELRRQMIVTGERAVLAVPLRAKGHVIGALVIADRPPRAYTAEEVALLQAVADQAALAVENARLHAETDRRRREAEEVARVARSLTEELDVATVGERVVKTVLPLLRVSASSLRLLRPDGSLVEIASAGFLRALFGPGHVQKAGVGMSGRVVAVARPVQSSDVLNEPEITFDDDLRARVAGLGARAVLGVPLRLKGETIGVLAVSDDDGGRRSFSAAEVTLLQTLADQAAVAVHNAELLRELLARQTRLETLLEVSRQLSRLQPLDSLLGTITESCAGLLGSEGATLRLVQGDELVAVSRSGTVATAEPIKVGESGVGTIAITGEPFLVTDVAKDPRILPANRERMLRAGFVAWLSVPIKVGERVIGVLSVRRRSPEFPPDSVRIATAFASQASIALENSRLYGELQAALARLEASQERLVQTERLRALGEMAGGVAHDFNNLLAIILGRAEILLNRRIEPDAARGLRIIRDAALGGAQTVRRIQEFTRLGHMRPSGRVDLPRLLGDLVELTRPLWKDEAQQRGVDHDVRVEDDGVPGVAGIEEELRELFRTILVNALEAMPGGGRLVFRCSMSDGDVAVDAEDTGHGMGAETRQRVFEPFFTTKGPQRAGLGLSVAWGIVTRHGGSITVARTSERGTTVRVCLPVSSAPPVDERRELPVAASRPATVLVVEDEPQIRDVLRDLLTEHGYTVLQAATGKEALALCDAHAVDLLLTDLSMPEMSGWDVIAAYRARNPRGPAGIVTGWAHRLDPDALQRHGIDFVVAKPFEATEVLRQVARALAPR